MWVGHRFESFPQSGIYAFAKRACIAQPKPERVSVTQPEPGSFAQPACLAHTACRLRVQQHVRRIRD
jgi:hypothetical protein